MGRKERIAELKRNAIICNVKDANGNESSDVKSRIGGKPTLPEGMEWPYNTPEEGESTGSPLAFMAQFSFEELAEYDLDHVLPQKGMVYFFYDAAEEAAGFMVNEKDSARILFYEGDTETLKEREFPEELEEDFQIPQFDIQFATQSEVPLCEEYEQITQESVSYGEYDDDLEALGLYRDGDQEITKLLGYADLCQGSMLLICEMIRNGIDCHNFDYLKHKDEYIDAVSEWLLLFQVDTISNSEFELMFGDNGRLYYYIRKEDLKNKNFENGWFMTQCY